MIPAASRPGSPGSAGGDAAPPPAASTRRCPGRSCAEIFSQAPVARCHEQDCPPGLDPLYRHRPGRERRAVSQGTAEKARRRFLDELAHLGDCELVGKVSMIRLGLLGIDGMHERKGRKKYALRVRYAHRTARRARPFGRLCRKSKAFEHRRRTVGRMAFSTDPVRWSASRCRTFGSRSRQLSRSRCGGGDVRDGATHRALPVAIRPRAATARR